MVENWLLAPLPDLGMVVVSAIGIYAAVIIATRLTGLRSFAQFSSFDFAVAIAIGSVISASLLSEDPPLLQAVVGLASLFVLHKLVAMIRKRSSLADFVDNTPTLLVKDGEILEDNLRSTAVSKKDLRPLLRRRNVCSLEEVQAMVLEPAGHISIIHSPDGGRDVDPWMMEDVEGAELFSEN